MKSNPFRPHRLLHPCLALALLALPAQAEDSPDALLQLGLAQIRLKKKIKEKKIKGQEK